MSIGFKILHQIGEFLNHMGLIMSCPSCGMPYRAYGGWLARNIYSGHRIARRRWLCKWCGHYVDERGTQWAALVPDLGWWTLEESETKEKWEQRWTPRDIFKKAMELKERGEL